MKNNNLAAWFKVNPSENLRQAVAVSPAPSNSDSAYRATNMLPTFIPATLAVPVDKAAELKRAENIGARLRQQLESRHADSPSFLVVLSRLSNTDLAMQDAANHAASVAIVAKRADAAREKISRIKVVR